MSNLKAQIEQNPFDHENYLVLLCHLKESQNKEGATKSLDDKTNFNLHFLADLAELRNQYVSRFLPDLQFWQEWLSELIVSKQHDNREIFDLALLQCPEYSIISQFLDFSNELFEAELKVNIILFIETMFETVA